MLFKGVNSDSETRFSVRIVDSFKRCVSHWVKMTFTICTCSLGSGQMRSAGAKRIAKSAMETSSLLHGTRSSNYTVFRRPVYDIRGTHTVFYTYNCCTARIVLIKK